MWFLTPGVGAQGAELAPTLEAGLRADGSGMLVNVSRGISSAGDPARAAAELREVIERIRGEHAARAAEPTAAAPPAPMTASDAPAAEIAGLPADLLASGSVRFGSFTLASGIISPIYLDLRRLVSHPAILQRVARAYAAMLRDLRFDRLAGIPLAALPIATAISLEMQRPLVYPRREAKPHGTRADIEGDFTPGETAVVIDDIATTGGSKLDAIERLTGAGLRVRDVVVLIDRGQGAREALAGSGIALHAVFTLAELLESWRAARAITGAQYDEAKRFLES
jgi:uridine monophosphate synthetase